VVRILFLEWCLTPSSAFILQSYSEIDARQFQPVYQSFFQKIEFFKIFIQLVNFIRQNLVPKFNFFCSDFVIANVLFKISIIFI
jgi:hypothetical protein